MTMFAPSFFIGFKWQTECTVAKKSSKIMSKDRKLSPLAKKVSAVPASLTINFNTNEVDRPAAPFCSFHDETITCILAGRNIVQSQV